MGRKKSGLTKSEYTYRSKLKRVYGITIDIYNQMYLEQDGCCKICGIHQLNLNTRLNVDHCHKTGIVRGLLCNNCNQHLGVYEKNKDAFERYLGGIY